MAAGPEVIQISFGPLPTLRLQGVGETFTTCIVMCKPAPAATVVLQIASETFTSVSAQFATGTAATVGVELVCGVALSVGWADA